VVLRGVGWYERGPGFAPGPRDWLRVRELKRGTR
jgi:hypothetical protein